MKHIPSCVHGVYAVRYAVRFVVFKRCSQEINSRIYVVLLNAAIQHFVSYHGIFAVVKPRIKSQRRIARFNYSIKKGKDLYILKMQGDLGNLQ